jgi:hypothetical protein
VKKPSKLAGLTAGENRGRSSVIASDRAQPRGGDQATAIWLWRGLGRVPSTVILATQSTCHGRHRLQDWKEHGELKKLSVAPVKGEGYQKSER